MKLRPVKLCPTFEAPSSSIVKSMEVEMVLLALHISVTAPEGRDDLTEPEPTAVRVVYEKVRPTPTSTPVEAFERTRVEFNPETWTRLHLSSHSASLTVHQTSDGMDVQLATQPTKAHFLLTSSR